MPGTRLCFRNVLAGPPALLRMKYAHDVPRNGGPILALPGNYLLHHQMFVAWVLAVEKPSGEGIVDHGDRRCTFFGDELGATTPVVHPAFCREFERVLHYVSERSLGRAGAPNGVRRCGGQ